MHSGGKPFIPNEVFHRPDGVTEMRLAGGVTVLIDTVDYPSVSRFRWFAHKQRSVWYAKTHIYIGSKRTTIDMHRILFPGRDRLDHQDGDGLNNRRRNIRPATRSQNMFNRKSRIHTSKYHGVWWNGRKNRWVASIQVDGKTKYIGSFTYEEDAYAARLRAEKVVYPDFERLRA
jgi:hypothetical protein